MKVYRELHDEMSIEGDETWGISIRRQVEDVQVAA